MKVGVLSLQGDFPEQARAIGRLVGESSVRLVRHRDELEQVDALLLPGGESTTIADLLDLSGLAEPLEQRIRDGLPVLATCAGLILLARRVERSSAGLDPSPLGLLDLTIRRNDYGRQAESFEAPVKVTGLNRPFPGVFIRAPRLGSIGPGVEVFARWGKEPVGVRSGVLWGLTFHPELAEDTRLHALWLAEIARKPQRTTKKKASATSRRRHPRATATQ
ncbi:MAG: pyridoxal 5'-phosphate synthase glutaminase subunit PdxT [Thermoplasmata archaeon]|nr:pyridoxal 5'-phosphate synthase glutaminase subunit PdxT [Thermoplasmata archaeon]